MEGHSFCQGICIFYSSICLVTRQASQGQKVSTNSIRTRYNFGGMNSTEMVFGCVSKENRLPTCNFLQKNL